MHGHAEAVHYDMWRLPCQAAPSRAPDALGFLPTESVSSDVGLRCILPRLILIGDNANEALQAAGSRDSFHG